MGLALLIMGLVLFLGVHSITTRRALRGTLIATLGEPGYKVLYGIVSLLGIVLIAYGFGRYRHAGLIEVWYPPTFMRHVAVVLMLPAVIMVASAYLRGGIYRALKHPMLAGIKLWAVAHLAANGDLGSIFLFGSFLAWAVFDRISLKHRADPGGPLIPVGGVGNDALAIGVGIVAYLALGLVFHPAVIGVPVFGV